LALARWWVRTLGKLKLNFILAIFFSFGLEFEGLKEDPNRHGSQGWLKNSHNGTMNGT